MRHKQYASWKLSPLNILTGSLLNVGGPTLKFFLCFSICLMQNLPKCYCFKMNNSCFAGFLLDCSNLGNSLTHSAKYLLTKNDTTFNDSCIVPESHSKLQSFSICLYGSGGDADQFLLSSVK